MSERVLRFRSMRRQPSPRWGRSGAGRFSPPAWVVAASAAFVFAAAVSTGVAMPLRAEAADQTVTMVGLQFAPQVMSITTGTTVTWENAEASNYPVVIGAHNIVSDDNAFPASPPMNPGQSWSHTFNKAGTYAYHCGIHPDAMRGTITVTGPDKTPGSGGGSGKAAPKTKPGKAKAPAGKVRRYELTINERNMDVLGVPMQWWTFNGTVPGTILRGNVGDTLQVVVHNTSRYPHSFHNHLSNYPISEDGSSMTAPLPVVPHQNDDVLGAMGGVVPMGDPGSAPAVGQNPIGPYDPRGDNDVAAPGETRTYTYKLTDAGSFFYHCHVFEATDHIEKGLFGTIIVYPRGWSWKELPSDPNNGNTKAWVTNERGERLFEDVVIISERMPDPMVDLPTDSMIGMVSQGGAAGAGISLANGRAWNDPYVIGPVRSGQKVLLHVANIGESPHAWHLHGIHFWRLNQEDEGGKHHQNGWFTAPIENRNNMGLFPGDLVPTQFTAGQPGFWFGHDHVVPDAYLGMVPWLQVLPGDAAGHSKGTGKQAGSASQKAEVQIVEPSSSDPNSWGYTPPTVEIRTGGTVTWKNTGSQTHSVAADEGAPESFESGDMKAGATWSRTFTKAGTYAYHCVQHSWMKGTVTVGSTASASSGTSSSGKSSSDKKESGGAPASRTPAKPAMSGTSGDAMSGGSPSAPRAATGAAGTVPVKIVESRAGDPQSWGYAPAQLTVRAGDTVVWTNRGKLPHTVTSPVEPHVLSSGNMDADDVWRFTFTRPGTYQYFCALHPWMKGTVTVVAGSAKAGAAASAGTSAKAGQGSGGGMAPDAGPAEQAPEALGFVPSSARHGVTAGIWLLLLVLPATLGGAAIRAKVRTARTPAS